MTSYWSTENNAAASAVEAVVVYAAVAAEVALYWTALVSPCNALASFRDGGCVAAVARSRC